MDNTKRKQSALGRFEIICERYIYGTDQERKIILSFLDDTEKEIFLEGCGLYHMFIDNQFYKAVQESLSDELFLELAGKE